MGLADLHIHTTHSWDGTFTVPVLLDYVANFTSLDVIAVTDHDCIDGALEAKELARQYPFSVIPGMEISTTQGHLIALFIRKQIPAGLSAIETIERIADQGGLCFIPHPTTRNAHGMQAGHIEQIVQHPSASGCLVGIETCNAAIIHQKGNSRAETICRSTGLSPVGSSDAHSLFVIGKGMTGFYGATPDDLRQALLNGTTQAIQTEAVDPLQTIAGWVKGYSLRKLGWMTAASGELVRIEVVI